MVIPSETPPFSEEFFGDILQEKKFVDIVNREYKYEASLACLTPLFSVDFMKDAYQSYKGDIERLNGNMKTKPDHFKCAGCLSYWLRRHSPVYKFQESEKNILSPEQQKLRDIIKDYGNAYLAFMLGYRACEFFQKNSKEVKKLPSNIDEDYIETVCYLMKYKSISPHAMGMIFRSLFFV